MPALYFLKFFFFKSLKRNSLLTTQFLNVNNSYASLRNSKKSPFNNNFSFSNRDQIKKCQRIFCASWFNLLFSKKTSFFYWISKKFFDFAAAKKIFIKIYKTIYHFLWHTFIFYVPFFEYYLIVLYTR